jgi:tryptophanyl-tRNA synthetase
MSKTYHNYIGLLDDEKTILKTIKQIQTGTQTIDEPKNPDECNVYRICRLFLSPEEDEVLRKRYMSGGLSYKEVKDLLYEKIIPFVKKIQQKYAKITDQEIIDIIAKGAKAANLIAEKKIAEVYKKIGFTL